jgi:hypothetical protein
MEQVGSMEVGASKRRSRMPSKISRTAGSGARHMVRYVSRKGSQIKTKGSAQLEMPTVLKITIWRQFWQHPANSECVAPPPARSFQISARTNTGPADRRTTCKRIVCPDCHGTSRRVVMRTVRQYAKIETPPPCGRCNGTGRVPRPRPVSILSSRTTQVRRTRRP